MKRVEESGRSCLNEVRKMVWWMKGMGVKDEMIKMKEIVEAGGIGLMYEEDKLGENM